MRIALTILALVAIALLAGKLCFPRGPTPALPPNFPAQWTSQLYSLDENEVARLVIAPYPAERQTNFGRFRSWPAGLIQQVAIQQYAFSDTNPTADPLFSSQVGTLQSAALWCIGNNPLQLDVANELLAVPVDGDWIVNKDLPPERRNQALESILRAVTKRNLIIEKRMLERDVIVARGNFTFVPMEEQPVGSTKWLQFYVDERDLTKAEYGVPKFLDAMEHKFNRKVIDETRPTGAAIVPTIFHPSVEKAVKDEQALSRLLENLSKQTSLEFVRAKRMIPIWFISDRSATTQPVSQK